MKEGEIITKDILTKERERVLSTFDMMINNGIKLRPIRFIIRHIIDRGYNEVLFPGTSLYSLLVSIPTDNKINFNKTLRIEYKQQTETLTFKFTDWTDVDRQNTDLKAKILWEDTCQATEGTSLLESLFTDNEDFKKIIKNKLTVD
jgi:hypothetical protein